MAEFRHGSHAGTNLMNVEKELMKRLREDGYSIMNICAIVRRSKSTVTRYLRSLREPT